MADSSRLKEEDTFPLELVYAFAVQQKSMSDLAIKLNCTRAFLPVEICERLSNRFDFMT